MSKASRKFDKSSAAINSEYQQSVNVLRHLASNPEESFPEIELFIEAAGIREYNTVRRAARIARQLQGYAERFKMNLEEQYWDRAGNRHVRIVTRYFWRLCSHLTKTPRVQIMRDYAGDL